MALPALLIPIIGALAKAGAAAAGAAKGIGAGMAAAKGAGLMAGLKGAASGALAGGKAAAAAKAAGTTMANAIGHGGIAGQLAGQAAKTATGTMAKGILSSATKIGSNVYGNQLGKLAVDTTVNQLASKAANSFGGNSGATQNQGSKPSYTQGGVDLSSPQPLQLQPTQLQPMQLQPTQAAMSMNPQDIIKRKLLNSYMQQRFGGMM